MKIKQKRLSLLLELFLLIILSACNGKIAKDEVLKEANKGPHNWNNEVIYHVMQRSFYDSNGDRHGDLNGFVEKLDYLEELGVTTILFTPLYASGFYHNYFPTDYEKIDPEYGSKTDYIRFVKAVHAKGMKFLMDMETQYAQSGHIWFDDSYQNPASEYSDFIYYSDSLNKFPEQIFMPSRSPLHEFTAWPGNKHHIVFLDLNHEKVKQWMLDFYTYWVDPNQDGVFDDGVDGFRIDHIMDDLDYKGLFTNMYQEFWRPIFAACKDINPSIFILGEQSNWNEYGDEMVAKSGADAAFSFPLRFALAGEQGTHDMYKAADKSGVTMDPNRIHEVIQESQNRFTDSTYTVNFLENHDTDRWATVVNELPGQKRVAAALNLLLPGIPSIYYGQELGMTGKTHEWGSDANHIPVREAFPWTSDPADQGNALWYLDTGEWWDLSLWQTEAIQKLALAVQQEDDRSLWHHYKKLISIRRENAPIRLGQYRPILTQHPDLFAFTSTYQGESNTILINNSDATLELNVSEFSGLREVLLAENASLNGTQLLLQAHGILISKT